jgi:hypothetical protein
MSLYGTFAGSGSSSSKMAAQNEPKSFESTTVVAAADSGFGDGGKGDGVAGWFASEVHIIFWFDRLTRYM